MKILNAKRTCLIVVAFSRCTDRLAPALRPVEGTQSLIVRVMRCDSEVLGEQNPSTLTA
jgi:hypothetical protein